MRIPWFRRVGALALLCALLCALALPAVAAEAPDTIHIRSAEDFRAFVSNCSYDAWSIGKTVYLDRDISLSGASDLPAASFGGTFEGGGHTISGLEISSSVSPAGLFGIIDASGVVRNVTVEGVVSPEGSATQLGGIAGVNRGTITGCSFSGTVSGDSLAGGICGENAAGAFIGRCTVSGGVFSKRMTGGVVGSNSGTVQNCENRAYVNTNTADPTITLSELSGDVTDALRRLSSPDTYNLVTDSGGIAGYSDGTIQSCSNYGTVGYQHIGYNVGGIAGRSSGHIAECSNLGSICGRKDVGGIVGVAEPYVKLNLTESSTEQVRQQLDALSALVDRTVGDAGTANATVSARLTAIGGSVDAARGNARTLSDNITGYADNTVSEINHASAVLNACLPMLRSATDDLTAADTSLTAALDALSDGLSKMDSAGTLTSLRQAADALDTASAILDASSGQLKAGMDSLQGAVTPAEGVNEEEWSRIIYGYTDENERHVNGALEDLHSGLQFLVSTDRALSDSLRDLANGVRDGSIATLGDMQSFLTQQDVAGQITNAADSLDAIDDALKRINDCTTFDSDAAKRGMEQIRNAVSILAHGRAGDGGVFYYLRVSAQSFRSAAEGAETGTSDLRAAVSALSDSTEGSTSALEELSSALDYLSRQDPLHFDSPGDAVSESSDALYDSLKDISDQLEMLNGESKSASDKLLQDIRSINNQFLVVMHTVLGLIDDAGNLSAEAIIEDTSDEDIDAAYDGKLLKCVNAGAISADIDAGGIAGSMMVYNELNPEGDEQVAVSSIIHRTYALKCILQNCTSSGTVTGKRSNVGAVCGDAQLGVIAGCEAYGRAESESGDNVGGIAGHADNVIRACWARCSLGGRNYLGGIVGRGEETRSNLRVSDCRSLVEITDAHQFAGAVAGTDAGTYSGNRFVSDTLAGLGRVSVQGEAEPIDYAELLAEPDLPASFRSFTLRFVAEGAEVASLRFHYGDSFGADAFPAIPEKEGMYGVWDREELTDLRFDTTVTAVYHPSVTAVSSDVTRMDTRPVFFASGAFTELDRLTVAPALEGFTPDKSTLWARLRAVNSTLLEQWAISLPDDGAPSHTVRFLPPRSARGTLEIYRQEDGAWQRLETETVGSYLCFELPAGESDISLVSVAIPWWAWAIVGALFASILALVLTLVIRRRPKAEQTKEQKKKAAVYKKRRRTLLIVLTAVIVMLMTAGALLLRFTNLATNQEIYLLLRSFAERSETDMDLSVSVDGDGTTYRTDAALYTTRCAGKRLSCVQWQGISIYYCDGALLLENGKAFPVSDALPDHTQLLTGAAALFRTLDITVSGENDARIYHAAADSSEAVESVFQCVPEFVRAMGTPDSITLDLVVRDGEIDRLEAGWTVGGRTIRTAVGLGVTAREHAVPFEVQNAVAAGTYKEAEDASEALTQLLSAWIELSGRSILRADVSLRADCGPLLLDERFTWQRSRSFDPTLHSLTRRGTTLFYTDAAACDASGSPLPVRDAAASDVPQLMRLAYNAVLLGQTQWNQTGDGMHCTVALDAEAMDRFVAVIAPEADVRELDLADGEAGLTLKDGKITEVSVRCGGTVRVVRSDVAAEVTASLSFDDAAAFPAVSAGVCDTLELQQR